MPLIWRHDSNYMQNANTYSGRNIYLHKILYTILDITCGKAYFAAAAYVWGIGTGVISHVATGNRHASKVLNYQDIAMQNRFNSKKHSFKNV